MKLLFPHRAYQLSRPHLNNNNQCASITPLTGRVEGILLNLDQGHHREHHFCFLPRFTSVDWEGLDMIHTVAWVDWYVADCLTKGLRSRQSTHNKRHFNETFVYS